MIANLRAVVDPVVGTTIVNRVEILRGRIDFLLKAASGDELLRAQHWLTRSEDLLAQMLVLPFDELAAAELDRLRGIKEARGIGHADLLVASIALARRAVLVTRNRRHFARIPGLSVVNWVDGPAPL